MDAAEPLRYVLGIDAGHASVGWAVIEIDGNDRPLRLHSAGVRRFEAGVEGDIERGRDETLSKKRREARGPRRQTWRRQWRMRQVFRALQRAVLLPSTESADHDSRHITLLELDKQLRKDFAISNERVANHVFPYQLRALAVEQLLPPFALGRALYHLAQRRGFLSNLKANKDDDERGKVKKGISELRTAMGDQTLGQYFASLDPEQQRIRSRWTARSMYLDEFARIWQAQSPHHPQLTPEVEKSIRSAIFAQRPLKPQTRLIGRCDLEPYRRRAPAACIPFQKFRLLQRLNDLEVTCPDGEIRELSCDERQKLFTALDREGDLSWAAVRKLLGMKKSREFDRNFEFNFEAVDEKKLVGNRTGAKLRTVLGTTWDEWNEERRTKFVDDLLSFESEPELVEHLKCVWGIPEPQSLQLADLRLEQGYGSHSRRAIRKLLPLMAEGNNYSSARKKQYPNRMEAREPEKFLPPFAKQMKTVRNPAVARTMAELRKVVNALIRKFGREPEFVRIELSRDLKNSRDRREQMSKKRDANEDSRSKALARLLKDMGEHYATDRNVLKVRLAEECNWQCPYTGRSFGMEELVGDESQFDIEHIIPFSRSLDNSFVNKTLCYHEENRRRKQGHTPFEAYGRSPEWPSILDRVRHFRSDCAPRKLQLFLCETLRNADDFIARQLNDTRYLSRAAGEYLSVLYGGRWDAAGKLRVQVSPGQLTAYLRRAWDLNRILGTSENKSRADHRHHAIDAFVIGATDPKMVNKLSDAAEQAEHSHINELFVEVALPWKKYDVKQIREVIDRIKVSSRVNRKLNGSLHDATILGRPKDETGKPSDARHVRKPLSKMSVGEIEAIVDDKVRQVVKEKLEKIGGDPKKAFADPNNHPYLTSRDGRLIPIHSARIRKPDATIAIGKGSRLRYVCTGDNHHMEIVATLDERGQQKKWRGVPVSRFEAVERRRLGASIIQHDHGPNCQFVFSLTNGEHVLLPNADGTQRLLRVTVISGQQIEFVDHNDARPITIRKKLPGARVRLAIDALRAGKAEKVTVDPCGKLWPAGD
jgi:CRISPR-associated endonuclease Csn1